MAVQRHVSTLFVCLASALALRAQTPAGTPDLPAAPSSTPPKSIFTVPPADYHAPPGPRSSLQPADEPEACYGPATGYFAPQPRPAPEVAEANRRYISVVHQNIGTMWFHNMPRSANDPWLKGAQVTVRFAILPDGRSTPPLVTVTSGRASFDKHALDAVDNTPFPPLPPGNGRPLAMCFTFRYNMDEEHRTKPVDLWPPPAKPTASTP